MNASNNTPPIDIETNLSTKKRISTSKGFIFQVNHEKNFEESVNIFQKFAPREPEEEEQQVPVVSDDVGGLFLVVLF